MKKILFALIFIVVSMVVSNQYLNAQVLEDYKNDLKERGKKTWFGDNDRLEVEVDLETFTQSFLSFEIPANTVVFLGETLWFFSEKDTIISERLEVLKKDIGQKKAVIIFFKPGIRIQDVRIKKTLHEYHKDSLVAIKESIIQKRDKGQQEIRSFFTFAILLIFVGVALYKTAYPYLFLEMVRPMSLFLAEDFSESGSLQKFFTFDILVYLLLVNLLISLSGVLGLIFIKVDWLVARIELDFETLVWVWLSLALMLTILTVLKFMGIRLITYLFDLDKLEFPHFFYLLRLVTITAAFFVLVSSYFLIHDFVNLNQVLDFSFSAFFWIYVIGVAGLFLIMMNRLSFKKYHLFAYLCIAELVPFLIISKLVIDLGH